MTTARVPVERGSSEVIERIIRGGSRTGRRESPSPPAQRASFPTTRHGRPTRDGENEAVEAARGDQRDPRARLARECQERGRRERVYGGFPRPPRTGTTAQRHSRCPAGYIFAAVERKRTG